MKIAVVAANGRVANKVIAGNLGSGTITEEEVTASEDALPETD